MLATYRRSVACSCVQYLNMIVHVREKDSMEHNGWEGYIAEMMAQRDLSFFPRNQAITLTKMKQREQAETLRAQATMTKTADDVNDLLKKQVRSSRPRAPYVAMPLTLSCLLARPRFSRSWAR